ncbi:MAG: DUF5668 domain-containing protein [Vicinamibacterales bacterium]
MHSPRIDTSQAVTPRVLVGIGLMVVGVLLFLDRIGLFDAGTVLRLWPVILIAVGVQQLVAARRDDPSGSRLNVVGLIWIGLGVLFLLNSLGITRTSVFDLLWPALLIGIGVRLLTRGGRTARLGTADGTAPSKDSGPVIAVLGGVKRVSSAEGLDGLDVTVFMGGAQLDYRAARLASGQEIVTDVVAVMGGCEIFVPSHWLVSAPITTVLGGIDDKRPTTSPSILDASVAPGPPPRLVLRGLLIMGGITIRS